MAYYKERVGYRANARNAATNYLSGGKPVKPSDGVVTVFAERRNNETSVGEYGGDAYPLVDEYEVKIANSGYRFGMVLVSDGVGNANFVHPSLERYLDTRVAECGLEGDLDKFKLRLFLEDLYGPEIFNAEYKNVLSYALKSFSPVPADGYFAGDAEHWYDSANFQHVMPFYKRDSQSLGSRIVCVGLYKTAIEWVRKNQDQLKFAAAIKEEQLSALIVDLKTKLEEFAFGEGENSFRARTRKTNYKGEMMFSYDDAPNADKKDRYYLASTVAAWFYLYDEGKKVVQAVSLNIGDARTYLINLTDGVRQISVDDAFPWNDMRGFVHRGRAPKTDKEYCDGSFFARIIKTELPCALFACSDGIYETVCNVPGRYTLPYGDAHGAKDILFEKNLLEAMRRSYSFDDFKRELIFTFYTQAENIGRVVESSESCGIEAKRDDSGTAAVRIFGSDPAAPVEFFSNLRATRASDGTGTTSLDQLWQLLSEDCKNTDVPIPYGAFQAEEQEDRMAAQKMQYANGGFRTAMLEKVIAAYPQAYESMTAAAATTVWGFEQGSEMWTRLKWKFDMGNALVVLLENAFKDWQAICKLGDVVPKEWGTERLFEHVIFDEEALELLKQNGFEKAYEELNAAPALTQDDLKLRLYDWFQEALFGSAPQEAADPNFAYGNRKYIWRPQDGLRTPQTWKDSLQAVRTQFAEEMAKQNAAANAAPAEPAPAPATPNTGSGAAPASTAPNTSSGAAPAPATPNTGSAAAPAPAAPNTSGATPTQTNPNSDDTNQEN